MPPQLSNTKNKKKKKNKYIDYIIFATFYRILRPIMPQSKMQWPEREGKCSIDEIIARINWTKYINM